MNEALIEKYMKNLNLTREEAIELIEEDSEVDRMKNSEVDNDLSDEQKKVIKQAKQTSSKQKKATERKPKEDETKEHLIKCFKTFLEGYHAENVKITNKTKIVEFDLNGEHYKLDLIRQRKPKK